MRRRLLYIFLVLAAVAIAPRRTEAAAPVTRSSCRGHFLAGQRQTGVYSLGNDGSTASRLVCEMPHSFEGPTTTVTTVIGNALETPSIIKKKSSSNFQAVDLYWLKDLIRTSDCKQTVSVEWPATPVDSLTFGVTLISLLNVSTHLAPKAYPQTLELSGTAAGIRHLLPDVEGSERSSIVTASSVRCTQPIVERTSCLTTEKLDIRIPSQPWRKEFSFRTDRSDQALLSFLNGEEEASHVRMENDFFLRVDGNPAVSIGQLSDAEWHTVVVLVENHQVRLIVDDVPLIVKHMTLLNTKLTNLQIKLEGEILLKEDCPEEKEGQVKLSELCSGCGCTLLNQHFDGLPSSSCEPDEDDTFQLLRDPDRLSFIHIPDAFAVDTEDGLDIRVATGFKSDSDAGLLLFGYWHGMPGKGRWQVHYFGRITSALLCRTYSGEETCIACELRDREGMGRDSWHRAVFFGSGDSFTFSLDRKACRLSAITAHNNVSTAEVYAIPALTQGVGLFVGGTYFEKKKSGLYKNDFTQRYFENTREKMPSLRGCVSDVFTHGKKSDLATAYRNQMNSILTRPEDMGSFAIQIGCSTCSSPCPQGVRCRTPPPVKGSLAKCDCADLELIEGEGDGVCPAQENMPVPLSTRFVSANPIVLPLETTKAVLSKLWLKIRLPKNPRSDMVVVEFNSHRETMFRVLASPGGLLSVESHPNDGGSFATTITHQINPDDNRAHLLSLTRRTPVGTRHTARKYELRIDGERYELPDSGKTLLNNVSFSLAEGLDEEQSVVVHAIGIGYDLDEHIYLWHPTNTIHQIDLHSRLSTYLYRNPDLTKTGEMDPYLWEGAVSPKGTVVDYSPDKFDPQLLLSSRWFIYSVILVLLLLLLLLVCLCCCCCMRRGRRTRSSNASDREQMMRDSPDYGPVKMRRNSSFSMHDDNSIGTDDTDLNAYRDIPSHRVKIYRESMVSILVPSVDNASEAAIVKRLSVEEPLRSPPPGSPAPLVSVTEEEQ